MPPSSSPVEVAFKASDLSVVVRRALESVPVETSVILPAFYKCLELDKVGQSPRDHLWIAIYSRQGNVALVLSCTDGYVGGTGGVSHLHRQHEPHWRERLRLLHTSIGAHPSTSHSHWARIFRVRSNQDHPPLFQGVDPAYGCASRGPALLWREDRLPSAAWGPSTACHPPRKQHIRGGFSDSSRYFTRGQVVPSFLNWPCKLSITSVSYLSAEYLLTAALWVDRGGCHHWGRKAYIQ